MTGFLLVFLGSGIGGVLRHGVALTALRALGPGFPAGTLLVNVIGSAAIGLLVGFLVASGGSQNVRLFLMTGLLGGFTTFSTFSLDTVVLWERGQHLAAIAYVLASVVASIAALGLGLWVMRRYAG